MNKIVRYSLENGNVPNFIICGGIAPFKDKNNNIVLLGVADELPNNFDASNILNEEDIKQHLLNIALIFYETDPVTNEQTEVPVDIIVKNIQKLLYI